MQFSAAEFWIINETGHQIRVKAFAGGRELFDQEIADRPQPTPVVPRNREDLIARRFPVAEILVRDYDQLTRELEIEETLYLRKRQSFRVKAYPDRPNSFVIRVTSNGFEVGYEWPPTA
jgi:hypothetical protein